MKYNILTAFIAIVMVFLVAGALFGAMTIYENDKFEESWMLSPTAIEVELKPLYEEEVKESTTETEPEIIQE